VIRDPTKPVKGLQSIHGSRITIHAFLRYAEKSVTRFFPPDLLAYIA
jgi:hypothetical protein